VLQLEMIDWMHCLKVTQGQQQPEVSLHWQALCIPEQTAGYKACWSQLERMTAEPSYLSLLPHKLVEPVDGKTADTFNHIKVSSVQICYIKLSTMLDILQKLFQ
jgi:hypothetical protein